MERANYKAEVLSVNPKSFEKTNGGEYNLCSVVIKEGPLAGLVVTGQRTIKNATGDTKEPVAKGQEVIVYHSQIPSTKPGEEGKMANFFEVATGVTTASDADINAMLEKAGVSVATATAQI